MGQEITPVPSGAPALPPLERLANEAQQALFNAADRAAGPKTSAAPNGGQVTTRRPHAVDGHGRHARDHQQHDHRRPGRDEDAGVAAPGGRDAVAAALEGERVVPAGVAGVVPEGERVQGVRGGGRGHERSAPPCDVRSLPPNRARVCACR